MSFSDYTGTSFAPWLLPIIPVGSTLSDGSELTEEHLGKIPGQRRGDVWSGLANWSKMGSIAKVDSQRKLFPIWEGWYKPPQVQTIGIAGRLFPAIDIDVTDPDYADLVQRVAFRVLGETIVRGRSNSGKCLLMYRLDQPCDFITKARLPFQPAVGTPFTVEVLGLGQQYLIEGMHRSGVPYQWSGGNTPLLAGAENLPKITPAKIYLFIQELRKELAFLACMPIRDLRGGSRSGVEGDRIDITPKHPMVAPSPEVLAEALSRISVLDQGFAGREDWERFSRALKTAAGGDEEFYENHYLPWQQVNPENDDDTVHKLWEGHPNSGIGWDHVAAVCGYTDHLTALFDDLTEGEEGGPSEVETDGGSRDSVAPRAPPPQEAENVIAGKFVEDHARKDWIYVPTSRTGGDWKHFEEGRWQEAAGGALWACSEAASEIADKIRTSASAKQAQLTLARQMRGAHIAENVQRMARSNAKMIVTRPQLDNHPLHMGVPGGYVGPDGLLHEPDPSLLITKCAAVAPAPGPCPLWEGMVQTLSNYDAATFLALRSALGYTMTGSGEHQVFFFLQGMTGNNGKTTFLQIISRLMGSYSHLLPDGAFVAGGRQDIRFAFGGMEGAWFCFSNEIEQGEEWATARLKDKTGSGTTYIERKGVQGIEVPIHYALWFQGNHLPVFRKVDPALRRRMIIFKLEHKFEEGGDEIVSFADRCIEQEGPQIMRWLLSARQDYLKEGLLIPRSMIAERDEYINSQDALRQFIEEDLDFVPGGVITSEELYEAWRNWREMDGRKVEWSGSKETFCRSFVAHELCSQKITRAQKGKGRRRRRLFIGIKFREHAEEDDAAGPL